MHPPDHIPAGLSQESRGCSHVASQSACLQRSLCRRGTDSTRGQAVARRRSLQRALGRLSAAVALPNGARQAVQICRMAQEALASLARHVTQVGRVRTTTCQYNKGDVMDAAGGEPCENA